ncbi:MULTISPECIES: CDP-diacylglycerol--serine O-phosphatidyltransferase [Prosthecochloris]|uniref:CDP-diacylglycerol--serine O-phosphatidyltransferase n=1 Tax=Prosthecochloris marina TaxID=2017681 RepID=A0A317T9A7_9CHLB|nr:MULTISPECIES: CDP-diacylglycerol--serine O-phosphatidyltransferase [Prosthecochloris]PWW82001.1 CDP-diacylglycerol--serine O-phosphatidyltransferase [Prosthecochloris marina]UZJ36665.1 CDP-diacylglycerol--serine O-phosphatidyltransferase [Prosthecochloris sp. SCSIO W1103]
MRNDKKKDNFRERRTGLPFVFRSFIPSVLTVMNMVCGYVAIVMSGSDRFVVAGWVIVLAALFDVADGFVARMTDTASRFGIELDSLSDLVSFGVAPAYLVYKFGLEDIGAVKGVILSSMLVVGSGLRLARFNAGVPGYRKDFFSGLPTPAQALTVASFVLWMDAESFLDRYQLQNALSLLTVVLAFLMVSRVNYDAFPEPTLETVREKPLQMFFYLTVFFCVLIYQAKALFLAMLLYILLGVLRSLSLFFRQIVLQR